MGRRVDVEALLASVSDESPAGEDLSYDAERQVIESAFESTAEEEGVDLRDTLRLIEAQSARTKDVWLAIYLTRGGARLGRLDVALAGTQMLAGLFERYWDSVHPTLDEYGFQGRKGPCESLTRIGEFLGPLRRTILVEHPRLGRYSAEDFERFATEGDAADGYGMFRAAMDDTPTETVATAIDQLDQMRDAIRRADAVLTENAEGDTATNFQTTYEAINTIRRALAPYAGLAPEAAVAADEAENGGSADMVDGGGGSGGPRIAGRVDSREDVLKAFDAIADYYLRREPNSPVPVALRRARSWVTMDFMTIMEDIVPNGIGEARTVLLSREEQNSSSY
ncbi:type VI secretion system protein TssA [Sphingomonas sp.]|uniref:type VI secretion system protein TssA n=1 Tax=Sphingomonas sp. TaxID=28214 RepID=UPI002DD6B466|nr:type VI secretion system ImpA family N-terminal domain-containing protein [Sphingomonas sp.]